METNLMLFSGRANMPLGQEVAKSLGVELGQCALSDFSDGEISIQIEQNVRGLEVFVLQSTCEPAARNLMELLLIVDALRRASVQRVTAVVPYMGYARQDRRVRSARVPISAKVVAGMMCGVGVDRVLVVDLHAETIQGFFDVPVDNVYGAPLLAADIRSRRKQDAVIVSPDIGGVVRARAMAKSLGEADLAIIEKRRAQANQSEVMNLIGDVEGRTCLMVDDIVDTAGTLCTAAKTLKDNGAVEVAAYCTHPVLSGAAIDNIEKSQLDELVVTNTIPLNERAADCARIRQLSIANLLGQAISRIYRGESVSALFEQQDMDI